MSTPRNPSAAWQRLAAFLTRLTGALIVGETPTAMAAGMGVSSLPAGAARWRYAGRGMEGVVHMASRTVTGEVLFICAVRRARSLRAAARLPRSVRANAEE